MAKVVKITGVSETVQAIGKALVKDSIRIADGLQLCGEAILKKADHYCPVLTGIMRSTGEVVVEGKGLWAHVGVTYGGDAAPYTLWVHENLISYHEPPTCAQWLTRATRESKTECENILSRTMKSSTSYMIGGEAVDLT